MPLLELGKPVVAALDMIERLSRNSSPSAKPRDLEGAFALYDGKRLVAFVDTKTGESRVFPKLEGLKPGQDLAARAKAEAARFARDKSLFPEDATRAVPLRPITLVAAQRPRKGRRTRAREYLAYVRIQRQVDGAPVWGIGTRAALAVAGDDAVHALSHRWRPAQKTTLIEPHPRAQIAEAILAQLKRVPASSKVRVDRVVVGYYDGGGKFLQPVYRFEATVILPPLENDKRRLAHQHVFGYVPVGAAPERLPMLGAKVGKPPVKPPTTRAAGRKREPGDPTVGRYVVRNDASGWVTSANEFFSGLQLASTLFGSPITFTNSQYYWAEPRLFTTQKNSFVNSVQLALNEVHGNWWLFSTRDNSHDLVSLTDIPSSGYGSGSGSLKYWIIHSCEVIPTTTDEANSFDVWWNIFNGLRAVVGYRTEMWINDHVTGKFGLLIGLGAAFVPAWLNDIASDDSYDPSQTYLDDNRGIKEPMGRASAVVVCGHTDDIVSQVGSLGPANCLTEWWFNN
jgi:hypothetical protein